MRLKSCLVLAGIIALVVGIQGITIARTPSLTQAQKKERVVQLLKSLETRDPRPLRYINPDKYIQHNLGAKDGLEGLTELISQIPTDSIKVNPIRVFADGNYVVVHTDYEFFGPKVGFDIFRFENGKIVEHWDNLTDKVSTPNPSGRTQLDGPTEVIVRKDTHINKTLVRNFITTVLINQDQTRIAEFIDPDNYKQHNPDTADNLFGIQTAAAKRALKNISMIRTKIHKVLGEGNFVLAVSEGEYAGKPAAFYDLFRVENGKIAEHWDVIEPIPERKEWRNSNGKF